MTTVKTKLTKNEQGFYNYNDIVDYRTAKQFLNQEFGKDWHMKIDLALLDMDSPFKCVLAKLDNTNYCDACSRLFATHRPADYHNMENVWPFGSKTTINWKQKIAKRQAKTAKKLLTKFE